jgi:rhamnosyltransferase
MLFSVVVLYKPDNLIKERLLSLANDSDFLYIVVNQSAYPDDLLNLTTNSRIIVLGENVGLAKALNIGIKECFTNKDCNYIALFDQDSEISNGTLRSIENLFIIQKNKIAAIGHFITDVKNNITNALQLTSTSIVDYTITSGTVYSRSALEIVGLMDETFFIDFIDYEWHLRAKQHGYITLIANHCRLDHNLGDNFINFFGIRKPIHTNTIRHFYITRNQLILINRKYVSLKQKIIFTFKFFYRIPGYIFFSKNRWSTIRYILKGIADFVINYKSLNKIKY